MSKIAVYTQQLTEQEGGVRVFVFRNKADLLNFLQKIKNETLKVSAGSVNGFTPLD